MSDFTPGPWGFHPHLSNPDVRSIPVERDYTFRSADYQVAAGDKLIGEVVYRNGAKGFPSVDDYAEFEANAHLIAAAPELFAVNENWRIKGPDDDGLLWLILPGKGTTGQAMFNLGRARGIAGQVAMALEDDRVAALAKAKGQS